MQNPGVPWPFFFFFLLLLFKGVHLSHESEISSPLDLVHFTICPGVLWDSSCPKQRERKRKKERDRKRKERETETSRIWIWISNTKRAFESDCGILNRLPHIDSRTNRLLTGFWVKKESIQQCVADSGPVLLILSPPDSATSLYIGFSCGRCWFEALYPDISFCWDWQLLRVVTRFVSESSLVTFRPYCRFAG